MAVGGSVAVVLVLGFAGRIFSRRNYPDRGLREPPRAAPALSLQRVGRYVVAVGAAGTLALLLGMGHNYWAMVAAAAPIAAADATAGLTRSVHRIIGTYGGVILTALLLLAPWTPFELVFLLALLQFIGEVFVIRNYSVALVFMTPVALLMTEFVARQPPHVLVMDRAVATTVGAVTAFLVIWFTTRTQRATVSPALAGAAPRH